jgi:F-type H+-transporting ATPase subunit delta
VTTLQDAITSEAGERYARAMYELADEADAVAAVEKDVDAFLAAFVESAELSAALTSPIYGATGKAAALAALADALKAQTLTRNFLSVLARNGRARDLKDVLRAFKIIAARRRGTATADVTSADPLTQAQLKELNTALKTALGRDVEIRTQVREDLIGGLIVTVGSRMFDSSLKTKLEGLRKTMKEA